jgi:hypothetical protein
MHINTIQRPDEFPTRPPVNKVGEDTSSVPDRFKITINFKLCSLPLDVAIVDQAEPNPLKQFLPWPPNVIKSHVISFEPELPHHGPVHSHPDFFHQVKTSWDEIRKNTLLPIKRSLGTLSVVLSHQKVEDVDAPPPRHLSGMTLPESVQDQLVRPMSTDWIAGVEIPVDPLSPSIHGRGAMPDKPK